MPRKNLIEEIDCLLEKIADAQGNGPNQLYKPLASIQYTSRLNNYAMRGNSHAKRPMAKSYYMQVRRCLEVAERKFGGRVLTSVDLERLDRAFELYQVEAFIVHEKEPRRWELMIAEHGLTRENFESAPACMSTLYPLLYEPMLRGEKDVFDARYGPLKTALYQRHWLFPLDDEKYREVVEIFLVCTAFCFYRFGDTRELASLAEIRRLYRNQKSDLLFATMLGHGYFNNRRGTSASRAAKMYLEGAKTDWAGFFSDDTDLGRAAHSATLNGYDLTDRPHLLHGYSVGDSFKRHIESCWAKGRVAQALIFETLATEADARHGRLDVVEEKLATIKYSASCHKLNVPMLEEIIHMATSRAFFYASQKGGDTYLIRAGQSASEALQAHEKTGNRRITPEDTDYLVQLLHLTRDRLGRTDHIKLPPALLTACA